MNVQIARARAGLREPFVTSHGTRNEVELIILRLRDGQGHEGWGEAVGVEVEADAVAAELERCCALLESMPPSSPREEILSACGQACRLPQALAAVDLALWDLAGRRAGEPAWRLLGATGPPPAVEVNATIAAPDRAGAAAAASRAVAEGFGCLKVKVGIGDDAGRVAAVRAAAGPGPAIRLDANGAWSVTEAAAALRALEPAGIELCEEPVSGLGAVRSLAPLTGVPVSLDETAADPGALESRICHAVCLKVARCGGITPTLAAARAARAAGYLVYLASTLDGPLGIAAALHVAAAIGPDLACGLATLSLFSQHPRSLVPEAGSLTAPSGPGLGFTEMAWYGQNRSVQGRFGARR